LQALLTLVGLLASYWLGNRAFREEGRRELQKEHLSQGKNLARVKVCILNVASEVKEILRIRATMGGQILRPQFESAMTEIEETKDLLRALMLGELPNPKVVAYVNSAARLSADFAAFCRYAVQEGHDKEELAQKMREFMDEMSERHDALQEFHTRFSVDPDAEFNWQPRRKESPDAQAQQVKESGE